MASIDSGPPVHAELGNLNEDGSAFTLTTQAELPGGRFEVLLVTPGREWHAWGDGAQALAVVVPLADLGLGLRVLVNVVPLEKVTWRPAEQPGRTVTPGE